MTAIAALVLVGGKSSRMGRDKAPLPLPGGESFLTRTVKIAATVYDNVWISVAPGQSYPGLPCLEDQWPGAGPMGAVATALDYLAPRGFAAVHVVACDLPFLVPEILSRPRDAYIKNPEYPLTVWQNAATGRLEILAAVYSAALRPLLRASLEKWLCSLKHAIPKSSANILPYGPELGRYFYNCNTAAQYSALFAPDRLLPNSE